MFPLGTVLFPYALLPLHVFEPRYQALTRRCLDTDREMGIVLIERGSEVGGGDMRFSVGSRARIVEAHELDDGRWVLLLSGIERIKVREWLPERPYPLAVVDVVADERPGPAGPAAQPPRGSDGPAGLAAQPPRGSDGPDASRLQVSVERRLRQVLALLAELGEPAPPATVEIDADPTVSSYQAASLSPIGPVDAQRLLETRTTAERLQLLDGMLADHLDVLAHRVAGR